MLRRRGRKDTNMRRYGKWPGRPSGYAESPAHCIAEVPDHTMGTYRPPEGGRKRQRRRQCRGPRSMDSLCAHHWQSRLDAPESVTIPEDEQTYF